MDFTGTFLTISVVLFLMSWLVVELAIVFYYRPRFGTRTITAEVQRLSGEYPAIPFFAGLVIGLLTMHFWGCF
jgi:hypothetical protein